ncbi:SusC/RagA family TonB-linked outer membrane protein [Niabella sp. 22666]|uniref:SusC/RagA family TonB-linked outer membrane protein n=1 Tax=Niabella sp. 22666 TaxID=3453954 RepID=UPI003F8275C2
MRSKLIKICLSGILFCLLIPFVGFSQTPISVNGMVTDVNGLPLEGVTVNARNTVNKKLEYNTTTNDGGVFSFTNVSPEGKYSLTFSRIGYKEHTITGYSLQDQATTSIIVKLVADQSSLDGVVITGYQKIDKRKFTGSVSQVDLKNIDRSGSVDVSRMLQGAAAGVSVQNVSGTFGATPKIRIRGNASISANQEPLYVVNGVPITSPANVSVSQLYSGDPASLLGSAIAGLNAQDIEDIAILKDGAATSLYGTRAANGVISITTKSGKKNQRSINVSSALTVGVKPTIRDYNVMNSAQETEFYKELFDKGYLSNSNWPSATGAYTDAYRRYALNEITMQQSYNEIKKSANSNTDWFDVLFRNNLLQEHSASFSGGGDKNTYYISGSYANDDGQAIGYNMERGTTDFRSIFNLTPKLNLDLNLNWSIRDQEAPGTYNSGTTYSDVSRVFDINPAIYAMNTSRSMYPYNSDGGYKYYLSNYAPFNIVEELKENFTRLKAQEVRVLVKPSYQISNAFKYELLLSLRKANSQYDHTVTERSNVANAYRVDYNDVLRNANTLLYKDPTDPYAYFETILPKGGFLYTRNNRTSSYNIRNSLNFRKKWSNHSVDATGGIEINSDRTDRQYTKAIGYMYYGGKIISPSRLAMIQAVQNDDRLYIESFTQQNAVGYYASAQYSLLDKYNFEAGGRMDASNMFGRLTRSKFLPNYSFGFSWNVDNEKFFENINQSGSIDYLKLRTSYALRGNAYQSSPTRNASYLNLVRLDNQNSETGIDISSPELFNLNWEKDYITNFGLEVSMFNRFNLTAEYYSRKNKDLIASINVAQEEGFTNKTINFATMQNKGVDITLGIKDILNNENFKWGVNFIYGHVKNKVISGELASALLTQITRSNGYPLDGYPLEGLFAYKFAYLNGDGRPMFYKGDEVANGIIATEKNRDFVKYIGSRQPINTGSFANTFAYRGFELRAFFTFAQGHKVFLSPIASRTYSDNNATSADLVYRWSTIGDEAYTNIPGLLSTIQRVYLNTISNIDEVAYNRSDYRVADASTLRLTELMLSYDVNPNILSKTNTFKSIRFILSGNNIKYWASRKLNGVDPELLLTGVALPNPRSFSFRITAGF